MRTIRTPSTLALALSLLVGPLDHALADPGSMHDAGLLPTPANRIVGTWRSTVVLQPCGGGPTLPTAITLLTYHAGGTLTDTNTAPPTSRSPGHGLWRYVSDSQYRGRFQVFAFLPTGQYDGYTEVRTTVILSGDSNTSSVVARRYNADGSLRVELCGNGSGERLMMD